MQARTSFALALLVGAAGVAITPAGARAHFTKQYLTSSSYWFQFSDVPDLDQVRSDLPNDGRLFCVPTTAIDWLGYLTNHGSPALATGPANWEAQGNYNLATFYIASMSDCSYMCTDPFNEGTDVLDSVNGLRAWLGQKWVVSYWIRSYNWSPTYEFLAARGLNGALLIPGIGWYFSDQSQCLVRDGGHAFAISGMVRDGGFLVIQARDPATDDDEPADEASQQSAFTTESYYCVAEQRNPMCGDPAWQVRNMYRVVGLVREDNGFIKDGYLDYVRSIFPQLVITAVQPDHITYVALEVGGGLEPVRSFMTLSGEPIVDAVLGADLGFSLVVTGTPGNTALLVHTPGFERWEQVDVGAEAPSDVVSGRHREAYVITDDGTRLVCFDVDDHQVKADVTLPAQSQALTYDDVLDEVIVLSLTEHAILRYPVGLQGPPTLQFPGDLPFGEDASVAWDPTDGAVWCLADGDPLVYRVTGGAGPPAVEIVDLPGVAAPQAIDVSDYGRLFVSDEGVIKEYVDEGGGYQTAGEPFFEGQPAGPVLSAARSRTNYEPDLVGDDWYHALPTGVAQGVPDCRSDIDGDGLVGATDFLALLSAWGTADPFADIAPGGGDLTVDVLDFLALLATWGPCPDMLP